MRKRRLKIPNSITNDISYNPETGRLKNLNTGNNIGFNHDGYLEIKYKNIRYKAHRVAYFIYYGFCPDLIDHINKNRSDNRICNLRGCSYSINSLNTGMFKGNTSGFKGVHYDKINRKWIARIGLNKKTILLGAFKKKSDAIEARRDVESQYKHFNSL